MSKLVIGGGISGVCCAQELARLNPSEEIILITAAETLLEVSYIRHMTIGVTECFSSLLCLIGQKRVRVVEVSRGD